MLLVEVGKVRMALQPDVSDLNTEAGEIALNREFLKLGYWNVHAFQSSCSSYACIGR